MAGYLRVHRDGSKESYSTSAPVEETESAPAANNASPGWYPKVEK